MCVLWLGGPGFVASLGHSDSTAPFFLAGRGPAELPGWAWLSHEPYEADRLVSPISQMKKCSSHLATCLCLAGPELVGSKVHDQAVTFGSTQGLPPPSLPPLLDFSKATVAGLRACAPCGGCSQRAVSPPPIHTLVPGAGCVQGAGHTAGTED